MADGAHIQIKDPGPAVISGDFTVTDADGNVMEGLNPIIAICRCGKSQTQPFCDGSHSK
jgi:CDGSH-type Zn-finger protein